MQKKYICFLLFITSVISSFSQINTPGGVSCDQAGPICADNTGSFVFQNNNDSSTNINNSIACLNDAPRPAWFFLRIDQTGDLEFDIIQNSTGGTGLDVDFVLWGPFGSEMGNCNNLAQQCFNDSGAVINCPNNTNNANFYTNDLDNTNIIDCSYSGASVETMTINNAVSGDNYVLLVTNFAGGDGTIEIVQTNFGNPGSGSTDCSIINVNGILGPDQNICEMTSTTLDANPNNDPDFVDFTWEFDDGTGFTPIAGTDGMSMITVSNAGQYQVTVTDVDGNSDSDIVELVVTQIPIANPIPNNNINACDDDNDGFFEFDFTTLDATIIGGQTDVNVSYYTSLVDAETPSNPIGLYTNTTAYTQESIFYRIENNINGDCASTGTFTINVFNTPIANPVDNQLICDDNNDGFWDFDLNAIRATVLGTQLPADYTVTFHPTTADADANTNMLPDVYTNQVAYQEETITVRIENNANITCFSTESFNIDVFDMPTSNPVDDQLICDDNNDGFWDFDLALLEADVLGGQDPAQFDVTFHTSQNDADMNLMPLASPYTNQNAYQQETIFVRIENVDNVNCADTSTSFLIDVFDQPTATAFTYELCDNSDDGDDTNGFVEFDLASIDSEILNGQDATQFSVIYFADQANADAGTSPLTTLYTNTVANNEQIVARVQNNDNTNCFETMVINLQVNALPVIDNMVELLQCDVDTDGISDFNLTEAEVLISTNPTSQIFTYHNNLADAESGNMPIMDITTYTNTDASAAPDTLFVRVENSEGCFRVAQLDLFVSTTQLPAGFAISDYEECDDTRLDNNITDGITIFDFSSATPLITAIFPPGQVTTVTYYESTADALAEQNAIPDITNHVNTVSPFMQTITFRIESDANNACLGIGEFNLVTINPMPNLDPPNLVLCDDVTVGDLSETFNLTQNEIIIFNGETNVSATYHLSNNDALAGTGAIATPMTYSNTNPTETIFVRVTNAEGCFAVVDFEIQVNPLPDVTAVTDFFECENNTDFIFDFDLETKTDEILNGQDPAIFSVTYHESQLDADNLTNALTSPYTNMTNPQTIFAAITNTVTGCSISTISFNIEVFLGAEAVDDFYEECDVVGENDGSTQFDLASRSSIILNGQDPMDFSISYHFTEANAINNIQPLPLLYETLSNPQIIYARVSNNLRPDECFEIAEVTLQTNLLPIFDLDDQYILCLTSNDEAVVPIPPVLDTQLPATDYTFEWSFNGTVIPTETGPSLIPTQGGIYDVLVTDIVTSTVTMCTNFDSTEVIESGIPDTFDVEVTSEAFTGNNMIIATATGNSTYEFSLDYGPWELDGEFEDVTGGDHLILVRDVNGCGILTRNVTVIDYPKFFTPNGDGNNDTWTIKGIDSQPTAVIYIFDRYGKLLKQLSPTSPGWDGTFNGNNMPSSDYWFSLQYTEPINDERRTFKAHFSLKR